MDNMNVGAEELQTLAGLTLNQVMIIIKKKNPLMTQEARKTISAILMGECERIFEITDGWTLYNHHSIDDDLYVPWSRLPDLVKNAWETVGRLRRFTLEAVNTHRSEAEKIGHITDPELQSWEEVFRLVVQHFIKNKEKYRPDIQERIVDLAKYTNGEVTIDELMGRCTATFFGGVAITIMESLMRSHNRWLAPVAFVVDDVPATIEPAAEEPAPVEPEAPAEIAE